MKYVKRILSVTMLLGLFSGAVAQTVWTSRTAGGTPTLRSTAWTGSLLVSVGDSGAVRTSPDGVTWTSRTSGTPNDFFSIAWTGSLLVAVGELGTIRTSTDGITWTARTTNIGDPLFSVVSTGTQVVAVGGYTANGTVLTSPDGITWTARNPGTSPSLYGVAWTGSLLVAVGDNVVRTSPDGITWTARTITGSPILYKAVWAGTQLVAVGYSATGSAGAVQTSPDGITWTARTSGITTGINDVAWTGSVLVAVGDNGNISTSPTGVTWTPQTSATTNNLLSVTSAGTQLVAVGNSGTIRTSPLSVAVPTAPVLTLPALNAIGIALSPTLTWSASVGAATYRVQLSTDSNFVTTIVNDSTVTATTRAVGPLTVNTIYYWRVNAKNTAGTSAYSTRFRFTTTATVTVPAAPTLVFPAANATTVTLIPTLTWNASAGAVTYRVQLSTDSNFVTTLVNDSTVTTASRAIAQLAANTNYYWRVNAKNTAGTSAYSTRFRFTTGTVLPVLSRGLALQQPRMGGQSLRFDLSERTHVQVSLLTPQGRLVSRLLDETRNAGNYDLSLPAGLSGSLYLLDFRAGNVREVLKIHP